MFRKILITIFLCVTVYRFWVFLFYLPPYESSDDLSLFNPVYMLLHYGGLKYPAYGYFETMTVHPPLHYYLVAGLFKITSSLFYAERLQVFAGFLLCLFLLFRSELSDELKVTGALSLVYAVHNQTLSIRPDIPLSFFWLGGLIALQTSSNEKWKGSKLITGSILLSTVSCMHYFASFAFTGIFLFVCRVCTTQPAVVAKKKLLQLTVPVVIIVGGYLLLQVLPNFLEIVQQILTVKESVNTSSFAKHYEYYQRWYSDYPIVNYMLIIPGCIWGLVIFSFVPQLRLVAWSSVPLTFFVFLFSKGKSGGYYLPEMLLFWWSLSFVALRTITILTEHIGGKKTRIWLIGVTFILVGWRMWERANVLLGMVHRIYSAEEVLHFESEQNTARACCKKLNGINARIGGRMDLWYVSGASDWYFVSPDLTWKSNTNYDANLHEYFNHFDVIADHPHMSYSSDRDDGHTLLSWYVNDTLKLKGFYITNNYRESFRPVVDLVILPQLFYSAEKPEKIKGILVDNNAQIISFESCDTLGDYIFMNMVTAFPPENLDSIAHISVGCALFILPDRRGKKHQSWEDAKECVFCAVLSKEQFEKHLMYIRLAGKIKDVYSMKSHIENKDELLKALKNEPPVRFFKGYENFVQKKPYY